MHLVRYYGYYSSKSRGIRRKQGIYRPGDEPDAETTTDVEIIDVSEYNPPRIPSKTWRECIRKVWGADALCCPKCSGQMRIIAFILDSQIIRKILNHLGMWKQSSRSPPPFVHEDDPVVYESLYEDSQSYEDPYISVKLKS